MQKIVLLIALLLSCTQPIQNALFADQEKVDPEKVAITYEVTGRFGNRIITYLCARWLADRHNVPLLYVPFEYSDQFKLHEIEKFHRKDWEKAFKQKVNILNESDIDNAENGSLLIANFLSAKKPKLDFRAYWDNPNFGKRMRKFLKPCFPVNTLEPPKDKLTVLAHVRTGGGYDNKETRLRYPNKFPPHSFYISAIEQISEKFDHPRMYVFIMTDDLNAESIAEQYQQALAHLPNIEFDYRDNTGPQVNILEDFFSIPKFDCLIRGSSTFSIAAEILADFKALATCKCHTEGGEIIVDSITVR